MTRLEQLEKFLEEEPNDPFNLYALALELLKSNPEKALLLFNRLLHEFENYIPTYYTLASYYIDMDETEKARTILEKGIEKARSQQDAKALRELQSALNGLME